MPLGGNQEDMSQGELSKRIHYLKCEKGGQDEMCEVSEKWFREGEQVGRQEGEKKGRLGALFELVRDNILPITDAAKRANMNVPDFENHIKHFVFDSITLKT